MIEWVCVGAAYRHPADPYYCDSYYADSGKAARWAVHVAGDPGVLSVLLTYRDEGMREVRRVLVRPLRPHENEEEGHDYDG